MRLSREKYIKEAKYINELLKEDNIRPMFIKTFVNHDITPSDFDVLIEDEEKFNRAKRVLVSEEYEIEESVYKALGSKRGKYPVDLHLKVSWEGIIFLESVKTKKLVLNGEDFLIPDTEDDFLINCAHLIYGKREIENHDLKYLASILRDVNLEEAYERAKEFGWGRSCRKFISYLYRKGLLEDTTSNNRYRLYKALYLMPMGVLMKSVQDIRVLGVRRVLNNLFNFFYWKIIKERKFYVKRKELQRDEF